MLHKRLDLLAAACHCLSSNEASKHVKTTAHGATISQDGVPAIRGSLACKKRGLASKNPHLWPAYSSTSARVLTIIMLETAESSQFFLLLQNRSNQVECHCQQNFNFTRPNASGEDQIPLAILPTVCFLVFLGGPRRTTKGLTP